MRSDSSENSTASPSKAIRNCSDVDVDEDPDKIVAAANPAARVLATSSALVDKNKCAPNAEI